MEVLEGDEVEILSNQEIMDRISGMPSTLRLMD